MFALNAPWWTFVVRGIVVYVAVLGGFRLFGRRELGQMTPFDLTVILLIANAVQNAMVGTDTSVPGGLLAAATLLVVNRAVASLREHFPWFRTVVEGEPVLLVHDGQVLTDRLAKEGVDLAELEQAVREHGIRDLAGVESAVLEVDGTVSVVPRTATKIRTQRRVRQMKHE